VMDEVTSANRNVTQITMRGPKGRLVLVQVLRGSLAGAQSALSTDHGLAVGLARNLGFAGITMLGWQIAARWFCFKPPSTAITSNSRTTFPALNINPRFPDLVTIA
jgi:hypothetical protein